MQLASALIAILYYKGEPTSYEDLAKLTRSSKKEIADELEEVRSLLAPTGLSVTSTYDSVELRTAKDAHELIERIRKEELSRDLGKAGLETLSIILYKGPSTRADIDYIRGVNSTAILRNLLIRGLIEKLPNPNDQRSFLYRPSHDLFGHLGITHTEEMPGYKDIQAELDAFNREDAESHIV